MSGGQPEFIPLLSRAAVAAGVDGVFMEVHDNPKEAKSDGANALESTKLRGVLKELLAVKKALDGRSATPSLNPCWTVCSIPVAPELHKLVY